MVSIPLCHSGDPVAESLFLPTKAGCRETLPLPLSSSQHSGALLYQHQASIPACRAPNLFDLHFCTKCLSFAMSASVLPCVMSHLRPAYDPRPYRKPSAHTSLPSMFANTASITAPSHRFASACAQFHSKQHPLSATPALVAAAWAAVPAPLALPRLRCHAAAPSWPTAAQLSGCRASFGTSCLLV